MQHLDFIVWMLGFPLTLSLIDFLQLKADQKLSERDLAYSLIYCALWFGVGYLLW